tara:strand:+ start:17 stop:268 length:252 start_codon:yes stop_codon:yes gene_type:complete
MKIIIKSKTKKQKVDMHKYIIKAIKNQFSLFGVSDMLYHGSEWSNTKGDKTKGTDFQGCEIQIIDTWSNTDIIKRIKERKTIK